MSSPACRKAERSCCSLRVYQVLMRKAQAKVDPGHEDTKEGAKRDHLTRHDVIKAVERVMTPKQGCDGSEEQARTTETQNDRGRQLEDNAAYGEYEDSDRVSIASQIEIFERRPDGGRGNDAAVEEVQTAEQAGYRGKAKVDLEFELLHNEDCVILLSAVAGLS